MQKARPKLRVGQVVFGTGDEGGEYIRVKRVGPAQDLGTTEIECFNPRWGGKEIHRIKDLRPLTRRERGAARKGLSRNTGRE